MGGRSLMASILLPVLLASAAKDNMIEVPDDAPVGKGEVRMRSHAP